MPSDDPPADLNDPHYGWIALRMIRDTVETLGPPGALPSEEAVLGLYGPEMVHEAQAICDALARVLAPACGNHSA